MSPFMPNSVEARDVLFHLHSQTNPRLHTQVGPSVFTHGKGVYVYDTKGKRYFEAMAGLWCASLGFSEPRLAAAAAAQYAKFGFYDTFSHKTPDVTIDLAQRLVELSPIPNAQVYFATSGSEATETMVKLAWVYHAARGNPSKRKIIARDRAFHGSSIASASMSGLSRMHRQFGLPLPGFLHTLCPDPYLNSLPGETPDAFSDRLAVELEKMILAEGPDTIAGFIAEPILAGGGIVPPPPGYFAKIQAVLRKYDILMLDDEVVCGFGRTGNWFGCQTVGMEPDMMAMAKGLSSGYFPISAVLVSRPILDALAEMNPAGDAFGHGFTNSGHPVGCAVALETLRIYEEMDVVSHVRAMGARLRSGLLEIADKSAIVGDVRGEGLMLAVHLMADPATRQSFDHDLDVGARFERLAMENGMIIRAMADIIGLCPPLIINPAEVDELLDLFGRTLSEVERTLEQPN